jgi:hypothetical protein
MLSEIDRQLLGIFSPHYLEKYDKIRDSNGRFVHYTSADAALKMLQSRTIWLRNVRLMNDFSEVEHGFYCLRDAYQSRAGERLRNALDAITPGVVHEIEDLFNGWRPHFSKLAYLACVSEHDDSEDRHGRLSMWRAYGGSRSVAIIINPLPLLAVNDVIHAYASPVMYGDTQTIEHEINRIAANLESVGQMLAGVDRDAVSGRLFNAFLFATLCTKHPGFLEEREWRIVYVEKMFSSERLEKSTETINGTPQFVYKLPIQNIPGEGAERGLFGMDVPDLLNRVIIGPSEDGPVIADVFIELLVEAGVTDAAERVVVSGIPLR